MNKPATKLQRDIIQAIREGKELTDMGRGYGIYLGETRAVHSGSAPVAIKTRVSAVTINSMVENGLIKKATKKHPNGNAYIAFELVDQNSPRPANHIYSLCDSAR